MEGEFLVCKTREAWLDQARTAVDAMEKSGAKNLRDFAGANYEQFCLLIEAYHALGVAVNDEMMRLAKMRPITSTD